eukprot:516674_1
MDHSTISNFHANHITCTTSIHSIDNRTGYHLQIHARLSDVHAVFCVHACSLLYPYKMSHLVVYTHDSAECNQSLITPYNVRISDVLVINEYSWNWGLLQLLLV